MAELIREYRAGDEEADDGHGAARRVYERAGYAALPVTRYFRAL
jgi:hypothetical protein